MIFRKEKKKMRIEEGKTLTSKLQFSPESDPERMKSKSEFSGEDCTAKLVFRLK